MVRVNFIRDTETLSVDVPVGYTMMEAAKQLDLPELPGLGGGCCACATCHVHVKDVQWQDKLKIEEDSLEKELLENEDGYIEGESRLSCQIYLTNELNNVTVKLRNNELL